MKRISLSLGALTAVGLVLVGPAISPVIAAPHSDKAKVTTLVLYAETRGLARVDNDGDGALENGDLVDRELALSFTRGGNVIGVSYAQAEIVAYNPEAKVDVRRVNIQNQMPGGDLIIIGVSKLPVGTIPQPGWQESYAIVGGTGKYEGARGSEKLTLLDDGKAFKVVLTLHM
jgi:hypothetical protein